MARAIKFGVSAITAFMIFLLPSTIVAVGASKADLPHTIERIQKVGTTKTVVNQLALALGIPAPNGANVPILSKAYKMESGARYSVGLVTVNGHQEILLERYKQKGPDQFYYGWRMSIEGTVSKTLVVDDAGKITTNVGGLRFENDFDMVLNVLVKKAYEELPAKGN